MKSILLILFLSTITSFSQISTNGVYVQNGITVEVDKQFKPIKESTILQFSNDLIVKTDTNVDFTVNSFFQDVLNTNLLPEKARFGSSTMDIAFNSGTATFIYPETDTNSSVVIETSLIDRKSVV